MPFLFKNEISLMSTSSPFINTSKAATGTTVTMVLPNNYKGSVVTTYNGNDWQTTATSSPLTEGDIKQIQNDFIEQEKAMNDFWQAQQKMFDDMWRNFPVSW